MVILVTHFVKQYHKSRNCFTKYIKKHQAFRMPCRILATHRHPTSFDLQAYNTKVVLRGFLSTHTYSIYGKKSTEE